MKILQRYILNELWLPFLLSFLTLNFIFMAGYLVRAADLIIGSGIPLWDTLYVLLLALPEMIRYTAPTSILTAVLIVFGSLSQNNEIRAMKASGIHPRMVMVPAFLLGLGLSFAMFVFNDQVATNADFQMRKTTKKMIMKNPAALIEPGRFKEISENVKFLTKTLVGNQMTDIIAYETESPDKPVRTIMAERGEIVPNPGRSGLTIRLFDGSISDAQDASVQSIQFKTYEFPPMGENDIETMQKKMRNRTLAELLLSAAEKNVSKSERREIWSSFNERIAFAFGNFIFVFLGIPVAILVRRSEIVLSFGIAMMGVAAYYILFVGAKTLAVQGVLPAVIAFWLPNVILIGLGCHLLKKSFIS